MTGLKEDGTPIRKTLYAKTQKELEKKVREYTSQLETRTLSADEKIAFRALSKIWIEQYKPTISYNTWQMYAGFLNHLHALDGYRLKDLKTHHLQTIINDMVKEGYAEKTVNGIKQTAAQVVALGVNNDIVYRNVFERVEIPSVEAERRRGRNGTDFTHLDRAPHGLTRAAYAVLRAAPG